LKPGNLLLSKRGRVKICDFGLAKLVDRTTASASGFKGTVLYSSPEQIKSQPLDRRTDIFSFGVTLYELLTGTRPFTGDTFYAATNAVLNDNPTPRVNCGRKSQPSWKPLPSAPWRRNPPTVTRIWEKWWPSSS
ncbi:protein kinase, partial [Acidobacteriia bacterium AH_259_A11_L15]|nr:protein kinase [Acidobacteriia bacterium AH_259_A11_L15]